MHGIDLRDLWRPDGGASRLTYRQVASWLDLLPGESAYKTALRDGLTDEQLAALAKRPSKGHGPWSHSELLLAHIADQLSWAIWVVQMSTGPKRAPKRPKRYPRPGVPRERTEYERAAEHVLTAEQRAYLERIHRHAE